MITTEELTAAFSNVFPDAGTLSTTVQQLYLQSQLKQLDIELDGLNQKRAEVLKPLDDLRIEINNKRQAIIDQLAKQ